MFVVALFFKWLHDKSSANDRFYSSFGRDWGRAEYALAIGRLPHSVVRCRAVAGYAAFRRASSLCGICELNTASLRRCAGAVMVK